MKTMIELITDKIKEAFIQCGYDEKYARVTISNRPDLCEFQCNGAMAAAKEYHKAPFMIADDVVAKLKDDTAFKSIESVKPGFINIIIDLDLRQVINLRMLLLIMAELMQPNHYM